MDEAATKEELRPVKSALVRLPSFFLLSRPARQADAFPSFLRVDQKRLKNDTDDLPREEKLAVLKDCLSAIGSRIETVVAAKKEKGENSEK